MTYYDLPIRLKISYFYFFLQGALGMLLCIGIWFFPLKSLTIKVVLFIWFIFYSILSIEVGKGLRKIKKWAFIVAIIICLLEPIAVIFNLIKISPITYFGSLVIILLLTLVNLFWSTNNEVINNRL